MNKVLRCEVAGRPLSWPRGTKLQLLRSTKLGAIQRQPSSPSWLSLSSAPNSINLNKHNAHTSTRDIYGWKYIIFRRAVSLQLIQVCCLQTWDYLCTPEPVTNSFALAQRSPTHPFSRATLALVINSQPQQRQFSNKRIICWQQSEPIYCCRKFFSWR